MSDNPTNSGHVHYLADIMPWLDSSELESPLRAGLIECLIEWGCHETAPPSAYLTEIVETMSPQLTEEPPALIDYTAIRVIPMVNQRLSEYSATLRVAPVMTAVGVELLRVELTQ